METIKIKLSKKICDLIEKWWNENEFEFLRENLTFSGDGKYLIAPKADVFWGIAIHELKQEERACRA